MRVVLFATDVDGTDVSEPLVAFKWAKALSEVIDLTVLCFQRPGRPPVSDQLPLAKVVTFPEPEILVRTGRFNAMLKPAYPIIYFQARRWLRNEQTQGCKFDIAHQLMPQAARYPIIFENMGIPYVVGPLGGTLPTPAMLSSEITDDRWYMNLRWIDNWRLRHDHWLRKSYANADLVLGVAPYMADQLAPVNLKSFAVMLELGVDEMPPWIHRSNRKGMTLLHVGRGVRTKGLRDVVRAMAHLKDLSNLELVSAGGGPEIENCKAEATALGVSNRITFLGDISHADVQRQYENADVFVFPSFREAAGGVLYEAMRAGLPIITAHYGGPGFIIDDTFGIRVEPAPASVFSADIASAIRKLYFEPSLRQRMSKNAWRRVARDGMWAGKINVLMKHYEEILSSRRTPHH
jgi:glycosyltransferase involved in cell wall biosynthesis